MDAHTPIELLPALLALLETESVTLAARRLNVGQPAMSRTLEKLRAFSQDELLVRVGRKLVRTQRASDLLPELRTVLASVERVLAPLVVEEPGQAWLVNPIQLLERVNVLCTDAIEQPAFFGPARPRSVGPGAASRP